MEEIKIEINIEPVTFGDFEEFDEIAKDPKRLVPFLESIVVGGARQLSITTMRAIMEAFKAQMETLGNPLDAQKKA